ncbi:hypothetical protein GCM10023324_20530 [Streptomyces youssoufiensis]
MLGQRFSTAPEDAHAPLVAPVVDHALDQVIRYRSAGGRHGREEVADRQLTPLGQARFGQLVWGLGETVGRVVDGAARRAEPARDAGEKGVVPAADVHDVLEAPEVVVVRELGGVVSANMSVSASWARPTAARARSSRRAPRGANPP